MEKIKYFMMMALVAMFSMTFTACEEDEETGEKQTADDVLIMGQTVGEWFLEDGDDETVFIFNANKTVVFTVYDMKNGIYHGKKSYSGSWTIINGKMKMNVDGETLRMDISVNSAGNKITLTEDKDVYKLEKVPEGFTAKKLDTMLMLCGGWLNDAVGTNEAMVYMLNSNCIFIYDIKKNSGGSFVSAYGDQGKWEWSDTFKEVFKSRTLEYTNIEVTETTFVETTKDDVKYSYKRLSPDELDELLNATMIEKV